MNIFKIFTKEKLITIGVAILLFIFLIVIICIMNNKIKKLNQEIDDATSNVKAYREMLDSEKDKGTVFEMSMESINLTNKELYNRVKEIEKENKIKDNQIDMLTSLNSGLSKTDTVVFRDTVFSDKVTTIDTVLGDEWCSTRLHIIYPSTIFTTSKMKSEKVVMFYTTKETINPPKKCWLGRLFQKKHLVSKAIVNEKNPYIESDQNEFYNVIQTR